MGQLKLIISIAMISMFSIAIMGFAIQFASDNGTSVSLADDPEMDVLDTQSRSGLSNDRGDTEDFYKSIVDSSVTKGDTLESGAPITITTKSMTTAMKNILDVGFKKIFGSGNDFAIFFTTFISLILLMATMYVLKTWLGRNPD